MANFRDVLVNEAANAVLSEFIAGKIRERVNDPVLAEKLIPKDHGFGTRRVPLETGYYEVYNQDNAELVDIRETPIERITPLGIRTSETECEFDAIIYATGFDPVIGAFENIDIRGESGESLAEHWRGGPRTYLGMQVAGFPNLFAMVGPHSAATFCNMTRCIEQSVDWIAALLRHMLAQGFKRVVPSAEAEEAWTAHVNENAKFFLMSKVESWFTGVNPNRPGKQERHVLVYTGGAPAYRLRCDEVAARGYEGFVFT